MGIDFAQAEFLDLCAELGGIQNPVLGLGSLTIREPAEQIGQFARLYGYGSLEKEGSVRALFRDRYNIRDYRDCDLNGRASLSLDLNRPVPADLVGHFGTILNGGTLEHVFDVRQAMENLHVLTRTGGTLIHMAPLTWYEHGFFNFNPLLFHSMIEANHYQLLAEGYYALKDVFPDGPCRPQVFITRRAGEPTSMAKPMHELLAGSELPANMMYVVALRKETDAPFVSPYQVHDGD